ncbi:hypothetical protein PPYR_06624 [Photinus pyralis]|uniref:Uncharacterized protein n=1 Tax=Photinus pyralis TaxID=7054 RepID=A0A5N4AN59_PHOPY|nr:hypothetical protein PPYR_06624 [Photinus pyralis]
MQLYLRILGSCETPFMFPDGKGTFQLEFWKGVEGVDDFLTMGVYAILVIGILSKMYHWPTPPWNEIHGYPPLSIAALRPPTISWGWKGRSSNNLNAVLGVPNLK